MCTVRCTCGGSAFQINCSELDWELQQTTERQMGAEKFYSATWQDNCTNCHSALKVEFECYEYPPGAENHHEVETTHCDIDGYCCPDFE